MHKGLYSDGTCGRFIELFVVVFESDKWQRCEEQKINSQLYQICNNIIKLSDVVVCIIFLKKIIYIYFAYESKSPV